MVAFLKVLFFASAAVAQYSQVTADLSAISASIAQVSTTCCNQFTGGGAVSAVPCQNAEGRLESAVSKAATDVRNSGSVTSAQATTILNYVKSSLIPAIQRVLNCIIGKKAAFQSSGVNGIVTNDLKTLSTSGQQLASALVAKAPAAQKASASALSNSVTSIFASAISRYNAA